MLCYKKLGKHETIVLFGRGNTLFRVTGGTYPETTFYRVLSHDAKWWNKRLVRQ